LIFDTLNPLSSTHASDLPTFLYSLLTGPQVSLLATYHIDIPLPSPPNPPHTSTKENNSYAPTPLTTLFYLCTAILRIDNLTHVIARKKARDRSLQEPLFGVDGRREGLLVGLNGNVQEVKRAGDQGRGVVVQMEIRRKSGRGIIESFVLIPPRREDGNALNTNLKNPTHTSLLSTILLLDEHPIYATTPITGISSSGSGMQGGQEGEKVETTFNLSLTEKQKRDREGVVLPYFDAQKEGGALGAGEGGRILYEMGVEDREDFDEEEDEI
jgi:elongator complex protein 5